MDINYCTKTVNYDIDVKSQGMIRRIIECVIISIIKNCISKTKYKNL